MILIAEDEPLIRMIVAEVLTEAGFEVAETEDADAAIEYLAAYASQVAFVFTDIDMPGSMDGLRLAHLVRARFPWIKVLIASGKGRPRLTDLPAGTHFIAKPYPTSLVASAVREAFAQASGAQGPGAQAPGAQGPGAQKWGAH